MKNITQNVVLMSLIVCILLSVVSCNLLFVPMEKTSNDEITGTTTPEEDTPDDLYYLEMQTVFEMARDAGYTGTLEELIAMFRGEAGPAGKDGVTPHIGANGNWWVGDTDLGVFAQGPQGEQGIQGEKGEQGVQGEPGRGILKMEIVNGELIVYYTDGTSQNLGPIVNTDPDVPGTTHPEQTTPEPPPVVTPPVEEPDYEMPDKVDLEGYTYRALVRTGDSTAFEDLQLVIGNNGYACIDFWVDEATSNNDAISYAVYLRNSQIEEDYNCRIKQLEQKGDMTSQLRLHYMNADYLDLTVILARAAAHAATQNLLRNLNAMPALDLKHSAYDQNSIKELAIGDFLYYLSGDMNVSTMEVCGPTVVNLEMYNDYIETFVELFGNDPMYADIYSLVLSKKWTIDTMLTMANTINVDVDNSDGFALGSQYGDVLGYFAYTGMGVYYFYGSGGRLTEIDDEGNPQLVIEKHNDLFDYLFSKFNTRTGDNAAWLPYGYSGPRWNIFSSGRCLFTEMALFDIRSQLYNARPFQYGILPNPTYEEGADYHSVVYFTNCNHLWAIPSMTNNVVNAQIMMNVFAAYSNVDLQNSTMYAYYERTLCPNTAFDKDSHKAMDIIKDSMVYDIALLYDWYKMGTVTLGELTISSAGVYAGNVSSQSEINRNLQETVEKLKNPMLVS